MGTYYVFYCLEQKEWIDPGEVNDGPIKMPDCCYHEGLGRLLVFLMDPGWEYHEGLGRLLVFLMDPGWDWSGGDGRWKSVRVVGDSWPYSPAHDPLPSYEEITQNEWATAKNEWRNVTREAIERYNAALTDDTNGSTEIQPFLLRYTPRWRRMIHGQTST